MNHDPGSVLGLRTMLCSFNSCALSVMDSRRYLSPLKMLSTYRYIFFAPENQNEVGVFAFYVFFENNLLEN